MGFTADITSEQIRGRSAGGKERTDPATGKFGYVGALEDTNGIEQPRERDLHARRGSKDEGA